MATEENVIWVIEDWAGNRIFPGQTFDSFEDGWEFVMTKIPDEDAWQDIFVVSVEVES